MEFRESAKLKRGMWAAASLQEPRIQGDLVQKYPQIIDRSSRICRRDGLILFLLALGMQLGITGQVEKNHTKFQLRHPERSSAEESLGGSVGRVVFTSSPLSIRMSEQLGLSSPTEGYLLS